MGNIILDINCHGMTCEDVSDLDSYQFDITITAKDNETFVPVPLRLIKQDITAACYRILAEGSRNRLDMMMAKVIRERATEAEWILAALTVL